MSEAITAKKAAKLEKKQAKAERAARRPLNRFFHHIDRGSTTGREIGSGLLMCVLAVCCIFMNMQLVSKLLISNGSVEATIETAANCEVIARYYFLSMVVAFIGTLAMGLIARLPICQIPSLGLSTVLISSLGIGAGLSYQNLLAVCLVSSLVYTVLMAVPAVRRAIFKAIPAGVRRAAPAAVGLLLVIVMLQMTGIVQLGATELTIEGVNTSAINMKKWTGVLNDNVSLFSLFDFKTYHSLGYKGDSYYPWIQCAMIGALSAFAGYLLTKKSRHPVWYSLLIGTVAYFLSYLGLVVFYVGRNGAIQYDLGSLWGRLWMVGSEDAQHLHLGQIFQNLAPRQVLREGFDFTAFIEAGGNVALMFATGIVTFLLTGMTQADAVLTVNEADEKETGRALLCNAGANIVSSLAGVTPMTISISSVGAHRDGARSGLSSVVASLGMLVSAFIWIVPFFFATTTSYDLEFNLYGHYGVVLQMLTDCSFIVADAVMAILGLSMVMTSVQGGFDRADDRVVFAATVLAALATSSIAIGAAIGIIAHLLCSLFDRERQLTIGNIIAAMLAIGAMVVLVVL